MIRKMLLAAIFLTAPHFSFAADSKEAKLLTAYQNALSADKKDLFRNATSDAAYQLANYYLKSGQYEKALEWWGRYKPCDWCGNGLFARLAMRSAAVAKCLEKLGRKDEAINELEPWVFSKLLMGTYNVNAIATYVDLMDETGRFQELEAKVGALGRNIGDANEKDIRLAIESYIKIHELAKSKKIAALYEKFGGDNAQFENIILRRLANLGEDAAKEARKRLSDTGDTRSAKVLALMKDKELFALLKVQIEKELNRETWQEYFTCLLMLETDEARDLVKQCSQESLGPRKDAATESLKVYMYSKFDDY